MAIFFPKKINLRGDLKLTFLRFPMRFLSEKNIHFREDLKSSFLCSLFDLCGHFEYNKPRFYDNFFSKKKSFKGGFKTHVLSF